MKKWVAILVFSTVCVGCNAIGPRAVLNGRSNYNEVLNQTADEQILNMIVRLRYRETFGILQVASVTANIKLRKNIGAEFGIGPDRNYAGNLVPLSAGLAYEENPTISYIPRRGETYVRGMLTPFPLDTLALFVRAARRTDVILRFAVNQFNSVNNPVAEHYEKAERFERVAALFTRLRAANVLEIAISDETSDELRLVLFGYHPDHTEAVTEFTELLGVPAPPSDGADFALPIRSAIGSGDGKAINVEMRSITEVLYHVAMGIEIPEVHLQQGIVEEWPPGIPESRRLLTIRSSESPPRDAMAATRVHDWWFYIDSADLPSKYGFTVLQLLMGFNLEPGEEAQAVPVLTVPVGG
jgi:hypothetical protein